MATTVFNEFTGAAGTDGGAINGTTIAAGGNGTYITGGAISVTVSGTGTATFATVGADLTKPATSTAYLGCSHTAAVADVFRVRLGVVWPDAKCALIVGRNSTPGFVGNVQISSAGVVTFENTSGTAVSGGTAPALTAGHEIILEVLFVPDTSSTGRLIGRIRDLTNTAWNTSGEFFVDTGYTVNLGTVTTASGRVGPSTSAPTIATVNLRNIRWANLASVNTSLVEATAKSHFISDEVPPNDPPVAVMDIAQIVEPYHAVSHTVSVTDPDTWVGGTVLWNVESTTPPGLPVTLTGSTTTTCGYDSPGSTAGATVALGCTPTDVLGLDGTKQTVSDTVLLATDRVIRGGVQVPVRVTVGAP